MPDPVADLVIEALVSSEWALSARVEALEAEKANLLDIIADLVLSATAFEAVLRKAYTDSKEARVRAQRLASELQRYTAKQLEEVA